jgi:hypothetical protein
MPALYPSKTGNEGARGLIDVNSALDSLDLGLAFKDCVETLFTGKHFKVRQFTN